MVRSQLPDDAEVTGLLALMLLTDARRATRTGPDGELIPLSAQNRALWDRERIAEGASLVERALSMGIVGPYQLQAAIAALHDEAQHFADTDWPQIQALYALLQRMSDNPMVRLNHAIATAMVEGPQTGLKLLVGIEEDRRMRGHHRVAAARAHLHELSGDREAAISHYRTAASRTTNLAERNYLMTQAARLSASASR
jgi:predicted RNA polymerase sigma factor